ncbi:MAG TPA: histidinol-phosphate transaminase [Candidatus Angelobacter sp.]|nr:histidinol-phosphate transaminase [Candidatus Angelobacter sp.]
MPQKPTAAAHAFHGGRFFEAIGTDFQDLARAQQVISADVLDAWFDPSPRVLNKLREYLPFLSRTSPPMHGEGLIKTISEVRTIPRANLCVGGGSSQLIFACLPELTGRNGRVLLLDPTYGEYSHVLGPVLCRDVHRHTLREDSGFRIDRSQFLEHARRMQPELVVIVNPNSPTGQHWPREELTEFIRQLPETRILVDETYIDYVSPKESLEREIGQFNNLVIIKSMSKAYALSGLRAAYLVAQEEIARSMARRLPPWSVSLPAQVAAVEALQDPEYYQRRYDETHALRAETLNLLTDVPELQLFDSCANFYLVKTEQSAALLQSQLENQGIFVRHCDSMGLQFHDNFLRIAVKTREQNARIAAAVKSTVWLSLAANAD